MNVEQWLGLRAEEVNAELARRVPSEDAPPASIHKAMRYSLLAGGKRLRPALVLSCGEALGAKPAALMPAACAIEMIHTYSLIHDDLPAMDDDDLRRGRPTCHKVFGEAVAILAGDALLTRAFQVLAAEDAAPDAARRLALIQEYSRAAGTTDGMIGGQVVDMESEGKPIAPETLEYIHRAKTGAILEASCVAGAIVAGAGPQQLEQVRTYGKRIGLAFQIADDVLDVTSTAEQLGKTPGKDVAAGKATYPALFGIDASRKKAHELVSQAVEAVAGFGEKGHVLQELARFVVSRVS
ncbi:MAG: polyprenyl synthetase family protein [Myxococcales bacterium]